MQTFRLAVVLLSCGLTVSAVAAKPDAVMESARRIPVAYRVDVVVVGGSTGAVSAAVSAAREGATVFLAEPRPYLGEDMTGTLRLWLEEGEQPSTPLARRIFSDPAEEVSGLDPRRLPFSYKTDRASTAAHRDTNPPRLLTDGRFGTPRKDSVEYDGDVTVTADLDGSREVDQIRIVLFERRSAEPAGDYGAERVEIAAGPDGKTWQKAVVAERAGEEILRKTDEQTQKRITWTARLQAKARYVRVSVNKGAGASRVLLGEIEILAPRPVNQKKIRPMPRPMHVKRVLDEVLLTAGVRFLYGCYATDVLRDAAGRPAGIVMANRAGRQAVVAKVIVDATDRGSVARMAGAEFAPFPPGRHVFRRVVVGGTPVQGEAVTARVLPQKLFATGRSHDLIEYELSVSMRDGGFASWAEAEQVARDRTFHPRQLDAADTLFAVPPDPVRAKRHLEGPWPGAAKVDLDAFRPADVPRLFVLGGRAGVSREAAAGLLRPVELIALGERIGREAARQSRRLPALEGVCVPGGGKQSVVPGDVRESLVGVGPLAKDLPTVPAEARELPVLGRYDVVVIGGGTSGAPAAIAAARHGAKTLLIEYQHALGGVGTLGRIGRYHRGRRVGFTAECDEGIRKMDAAVHVVGKAEYWRRQVREAGGRVWLGCLGCGAYVEGGRVRGAVVVTPRGRGVVLGSVVIDATGGADVAAAAGAKCVHVDGTHVAMQGTGLPPIHLGASYTNTDFAFVDDADPVDTWRLLVWVKRQKHYAGAYDLGRLVDTRERRRIVGEFVLSPLDQLTGRTYPDTIATSRSNFDTHGFTVHPLLLIRPKRRDHGAPLCDTPYRCLVPKGLDGLLVVGLGTSAHRDAMPFIRMQPDLQNQGYAAGTAAAMAARLDGRVRRIDVKALQKHLVEIGNLPERVLTDEDSFPLPAERVSDAVRGVVDKWEGLPIILAQPETALPLLREAHAAAESVDAKLVYAQILGVLGDAAGVETLARTVDAADWDEGWNFEGMGAFEQPLSRLDTLIIALGRTHDRRGLAPVLAKLGQLGPDSEFSHHRAVALALEAIGEPAAAGPLAALLAQPGMTGHALTDARSALRPEIVATNRHPNSNRSLREIVLARALFRCGDHEDAGRRILERYARDFRGLFARHARAVLAPK